MVKAYLIIGSLAFFLGCQDDTGKNNRNNKDSELDRLRHEHNILVEENVQLKRQNRVSDKSEREESSVSGEQQRLEELARISADSSVSGEQQKLEELARISADLKSQVDKLDSEKKVLAEANTSISAMNAELAAERKKLNDALKNINETLTAGHRLNDKQQAKLKSIDKLYVTDLSNGCLEYLDISSDTLQFRRLVACQGNEDDKEERYQVEIGGIYGAKKAEERVSANGFVFTTVTEFSSCPDSKDYFDYLAEANGIVHHANRYFVEGKFDERVGTNYCEQILAEDSSENSSLIKICNLSLMPINKLVDQNNLGCFASGTFAKGNLRKIFP